MKILLLYALFGLVASAAIALANGQTYVALAKGSSKIRNMLLRKEVLVLYFLIFFFAPAIIYMKFNAININKQGCPPHCLRTIRFKQSLLLAIRQLACDTTEANGKHPETMNEFLADLEEQGFEKNDLETAFICPHSIKKEISFEYFDPYKVKPGVDEFILLYEKPNNHPSGERTVMYNTAQVRVIPEDELYHLLLEQSRSPNAFTWKPSTVSVPLPRSWWERERDEKAARQAIPPTILVTFFCLLTLYLGLHGLSEKKKGQIFNPE